MYIAQPKMETDHFSDCKMEKGQIIGCKMENWLACKMEGK